MRRTRVRRGRVVALAALSLAGAALAGKAGAGTEPAPVPERYVVRPGDTLWEIARARVGDGGDPRSAIEAIREASGLRNASLQPGMTLVLPAG